MATMVETSPAKTITSHAESSTPRKSPGMKELREAIPAYCFEPSAIASSAYIFADLTALAGLTLLALQTPSVDNFGIRLLLWMLYGWAQGLTFTGIWILAHECGHAALFKRRWVNDIFGFTLHTLLLVPYFPWKYSHARHHRYANNMEKDTVFVPSRGKVKQMAQKIGELLHWGEDAPLINLAVLSGHQLIGWPAYLLFYITAGEDSLIRSNRTSSQKQSHFDPNSDIFRNDEKPFVFLTNVGLGAVLFALYATSLRVGLGTTFLLYGVPYFWVNHWIVAITYLHHTHPSAAHYEPSAWTFQKGAQMTIDRDFGFIGKHIFHGIIEFHVVHHLFARIPFYHAEEATEHIRPLLGKSYMRQDTSFLKTLWTTFTTCKYVEASASEDGVLLWAK